jgi:hypothetical protein
MRWNGDFRLKITQKKKVEGKRHSIFYLFPFPLHLYLIAHLTSKLQTESFFAQDKELQEKATYFLKQQQLSC